MTTASTMKKNETKHVGISTKRFPVNLKRPAGQFSKSGAEGDYRITIPDGDPVMVKGAISLRVLNHGELNLVTDTGRWYLFAPGTWKTAFPVQPEPGI